MAQGSELVTLDDLKAYHEAAGGSGGGGGDVSIKTIDAPFTVTDTVPYICTATIPEEVGGISNIIDVTFKVKCASPNNPTTQTTTLPCVVTPYSVNTQVNYFITASTAADYYNFIPLVTQKTSFTEKEIKLKLVGCINNMMDPSISLNIDPNAMISPKGVTLVTIRYIG